MTTPSRANRIAALLTEGLKPTHLELHDDSGKHIGHPGARPGGETHYALIIESPAFAGKNQVQRHQMVYALLSGEFSSGLHALSIEARTPEE